MVDFLEAKHLDVPEDLREEEDDSVILSRTQLMRAIRDVPQHTAGETEGALEEAATDDPIADDPSDGLVNDASD